MNGLTNLLLLGPRRKLSLDSASSSHPAWDQPDAHGIAPGHQPEAVVLDFVNPVRAGRRLVGGGRQARLNEADRQGSQRRQHRLEDSSVRTNRERFHQRGGEVANF